MMWFDVQRALAEIKRDGAVDLHPRPREATEARPPEAAQISGSAGLARPPVRNLKIAADASDPETLLGFLRQYGPHTYVAAASALGCGATRAWQAEARLRAAALVRPGEHGKAILTEKGSGNE